MLDVSDENQLLLYLYQKLNEECKTDIQHLTSDIYSHASELFK